MAIQNYRDIIAWQKAHEVALKIYKATKEFPREEQYGLTSQIRRAAVSVASNIVEGFTRKSKKDSLRLYDIGRASLKEVDYQLFLASKLGYIQEVEYTIIAEHIKETIKVLSSWMSRVAQ